MSEKKRKRHDVGQYILATVTVVCLTYLLVHLNLERAEAWLALAPAIAAAVGQVYSMTRGKATDEEKSDE